MRILKKKRTQKQLKERRKELEKMAKQLVNELPSNLAACIQSREKKHKEVNDLLKKAEDQLDRVEKAYNFDEGRRRIEAAQEDVSIEMKRRDQEEARDVRIVKKLTEVSNALKNELSFTRTPEFLRYLELQTNSLTCCEGEANNRVAQAARSLGQELIEVKTPTLTLAPHSALSPSLGAPSFIRRLWPS